MAEAVPRDPFGRQVARSATGLLRAFNDADVLAAADVHVATRLGSLVGETDAEVLLAVALAVAAVRRGSVCVDLSRVAEVPVEHEVPLAWPDPERWVAAVAASPLVTSQLLRLERTDLYLDRYWREEGQVCADLLHRLSLTRPEVDDAALVAGLERVNAGRTHPLTDEQLAAAEAATRQWTTILTGGPGTGKTTTVAAALALVAEQHAVDHGRDPRIALCAPTGKAATRLQESVSRETEALPDAGDRARLGRLPAVTLHRLLGFKPGSRTRFRHDRRATLPYDVVVVDESSMVSLTMMARLLEALRPSTRLVLVGDPDQLSSVEAGAVLADLVRGLAGRPDDPVVSLRRAHRFGDESSIAALAAGLRAGDADAVLAVLGRSGDDISWVDPADQPAMARLRDDVAGKALDVRLPAERGDADAALAALDRHRLLCAHRTGPYGVRLWNREVERLLGERTGVHHYEEWYAGRPVLVTANDRGLRLNNGDLGVTVLDADRRLRVVLDLPGERRALAPTRLADVQTVYAMTVHKSQGSQARAVTVVLPDESSPLLTRELFYTAVTRAQEQVCVVADEAAVRAAVGRTVQRASGLARRLRQD